MTVKPDSSCSWSRENRLSVSHCSLDITWFPFDDQVCDLIFESKNYQIDQLNVTRMSPVVILDSYSSSGEWELLGKSLSFTILRSSSPSSSSFYCNKGMTERKPTNDKVLIQTNNSYDITYGLKNYSQKDVWSERVAGKSVYAV